jgi:Nucleotide-diphospho-sugar transferase
MLIVISSLFVFSTPMSLTQVFGYATSLFGLYQYKSDVQYLSKSKLILPALLFLLVASCSLALLNIDIYQGGNHSDNQFLTYDAIISKQYSQSNPQIQHLSDLLQNTPRKNLAISVITGGANYIPWVSNLVLHYTQSTTVPLLIIGAHDEDCISWSKKNGNIICWVAADISWVRGEDRSFQATKWWTTQLKWFMAYELLVMGFERVLFLDADVIILQDPFALFETHASYDLQGLSDQWRYIDNEEEIYSHRPAVRPTREICNGLYNSPEVVCQSTGVMYFRRSLPTLNFLRDMILRIEVDPTMWEQTLFQIVAMAHTVGSGQKSPMKYRLLNTTEAGNINSVEMMAAAKGREFVQELQVILHLGWVTEKISCYENLRLWNSLEGRPIWTKFLNLQ